MVRAIAADVARSIWRNAIPVAASTRAPARRTAITGGSLILNSRQAGRQRCACAPLFLLFAQARALLLQRPQCPRTQESLSC